MSSAIAFTHLTEPSTYAAPTPPPAPFSAATALLMAQCCELTYQQFQGVDITKILPPGYSLVGSLTTPEAISADTGADGYYITVPAGFVLTNGKNNIIALRGTQTLREWLDDSDALPAPWVQGDNNGQYYGGFAPLGMVHGGFYGYYNLGTGGTSPKATLEGVFPPVYSYSRPAGSLAQQIAGLGSNAGFNAALPLFVTGHSLGAAVAVLCAMDVAVNLDIKVVTQASNVSVYALACPNVAAGLVPDNPILQDLVSVPSSLFVQNFNAAVPNCWLFSNACDIIPILPPPSTNAGGIVDVEYQAVTTNIISFCLQTGSIDGNHSCNDIYLPYIQALANGFV